MTRPRNTFLTMGIGGEVKISQFGRQTKWGLLQSSTDGLRLPVVFHRQESHHKGYTRGKYRSEGMIRRSESHQPDKDAACKDCRQGIILSWFENNRFFANHNVADKACARGIENAHEDGGQGNQVRLKGSL